MTVALSSSDIAPGTVLAGKYRVERIIGQGGMGVVVEARHTTLDDRVALKFLLPEYATHPEAAQRFLREARAAVKIKSPHVAKVSDVGTLESGAPYMVMEFLEGTDAAHLLEQHQLPVAEAIDYIVQAADALAEAHSLGIVHRDIKPANLFVTRHNDGSPFVKLLDFGISKMATEGGADGLTRTTATMGSALYMSPEQIRQSKSVDHRTDIYALGVTLYELLSGRQPFMAESFAALCVEIATGTPAPLASLRPDLPPDLIYVIERAFARDLGARFQTVAEFMVALSPWALPRSQPIIERVARSAGMVPRFTSNPPAGPGRGSYAHLELAGTGGGQSNTSPSAVGAATGSGIVSTSPPAVKRSSLVPVLLLGGMLVVLGAGALVVVGVVRARSVAAEPSAAPPAVSVATAGVVPTEQPTPSASVAPAASEAPPNVAPTAEPSAPTASTAKVAATPRATSSKTEPKKTEPAKPEVKKTEPTKPPPTSTKSADDYR